MYTKINRRYKNVLLIVGVGIFILYSLHMAQQLLNQSQFVDHSITEQDLQNGDAIEDLLKTNNDNDLLYSFDSVMAEIKSSEDQGKDETAQIQVSSNETFRLPKQSITLCEENFAKSPEVLEGFKVFCPVSFVLEVEKAFFGRHHNDTTKCNADRQGNPLGEEYLVVNATEKCGTNPTHQIKKLCDGRRYCHVKASTMLYTDPCPSRFKYMEIDYTCVHKPPKEKPNYAIVMFAEKSIIKENSIHERSINAFQKYAEIYNYKLFIENETYDNEREIYYMKLNTITEYLIKGLKEKTYDWIFWTDSDVMITNPKIQLSAFIPPETSDDVHLLISKDENGLNAGVFLLRVHPWSLSYIMRCSTYAYYHNEAYLRFSDQSAMEQVLIDFKEVNHYRIVPQNWFNSYCCETDHFQGSVEKGDFLIHFAGYTDKNGIYNVYSKAVSKDRSWRSRTNEEMRAMVLKYYSLPVEKQLKLKQEEEKKEKKEK